MRDIVSEKLLAKMVKKGLLDEKKLKQAKKELVAEERLSEHLLETGGLDPKVFVDFLSGYYKYPVLDAEKLAPTPETLAVMPVTLAERYEVFPVSCDNGTLTVAMANPSNVLMLDDLRSFTGRVIAPVIALPKTIRDAIEKFYREETQENVSMQDLIAEAAEIEHEERVSSTELVRMAAETPVIKITNALLTEAIRRKASDLFIEPWQTRMRIRCRVDGVLEEMKAPPRSMADAICSRIKVVSNLNIAERRMPQDGRFRIKVLERMIDVRVSIIPSSFGEKACLRILDRAAHSDSMEKLGFHPDELERIRQAAFKPYGMILVTGPTGSGKSTTLYSVLQYLSSITKNITTVEDPVEYKIDGINQVQINEHVGLTFPSALRSILRQDPDIIMLGEIRDYETLDIAIKAALTGHLVLSTLHTNDAASSVIRMTNMGLEPFLITASVLMVSAQRLVRRLCKNCKEPYAPDKKLIEEIRIPAKGDYIFYRPGSCTLCRGTGYVGRTVITEVLPLTPAINRLIIAQESSDIVKEAARKDGMTTVRESGIRKVVKGETTLEEVYRVTIPDKDLGITLEL